MKFLLINASTLVTDDEAHAMAVAIQAQLDFDFCPAWGLLPSLVTFDAKPPKASGMGFGGMNSVLEAENAAQRSKGTDVIVTLLDDLDVKSALGYHDEEHGVILARIGTRAVLKAGGGVLSVHDRASPNTVSAVVSHEVLETLADPTANFWADASGGRSVALEVGDPVQERAYGMQLPVLPKVPMRLVSVSDFVLPAWFDPEAKKGTRLSFLESGPQAPFTLTHGGYMIVRSSAGTEKEVFGELAAWREGVKAKEHRRSGRRVGSARHAEDAAGAWFDAVHTRSNILAAIRVLCPDFAEDGHDSDADLLEHLVRLRKAPR